jgi:AmmeMemoRadiSam system protein B/AmmeMemoRadiSam system protein A
MKKFLLCLMILFGLNACKAQTDKQGQVDNDSTRKPAFAGQFYSDDPAILKKQIEAFLKNAVPPKVDSAVAIIVPHAGYIYSGQIDVDGYNQVKQNKYDLIIILGTNHTTPGLTGIVIYPKGGFASPLGVAEIDSSASEKLLKADKDVTANTSAFDKEHSVEVQVPFIKYFFPDARILPLIVAEPDIEMCKKFAKALVSSIGNKKVLVVTSSDLSHYPQFDDAIKVDNNTLKTIAGLNPKKIVEEMENELDKNTPQLVTCACGEAPILAAVSFANEVGANRASIISYSNSGYNPIGSANKVVGYGAVVISEGKPFIPQDVDSIVTNNSYVLTESDKISLLKYARETLQQYFETQSVPLPRNINAMLKIKRGAFVTLNKNEQLRGCIGHMSEDTPLCTMVGAMALQAAFNDTRFSPLTKEELSQVEIEISVLTPFTQIKSADEIKLGRDGVIVKKGNKQAVFLPQVANETGWSKEKFLDQLCYKAGLNAGDWKVAELFTFQADVFSEADFH